MNILEKLKLYIEQAPYIQERTAICKDCSSYNSEYGICNICNCNLYAKIMFKPSSCPLQKW